MDKTSHIELRRVFLLENLPEPLKRADYHWQIFDNYIENTRLRLRSVRVPETKEWNYTLEQRFPVDESNLTALNVARIHLNEAEHRAFEIYEGREIKRNERVETSEIRKNRYFQDFGERKIEIDLFLGALWGLVLANIRFASSKESEAFGIPPFAFLEVTNEPFFRGENLLGKTFADVRNEFEKLAGQQQKGGK